MTYFESLNIKHVANLGQIELCTFHAEAHLSSTIFQMRFNIKLLHIDINGIASSFFVYKNTYRYIVQTQYTAKPYDKTLPQPTESRHFSSTRSNVSQMTYSIIPKLSQLLQIKPVCDCDTGAAEPAGKHLSFSRSLMHTNKWHRIELQLAI